jgi:hypothetical protein
MMMMMPSGMAKNNWLTGTLAHRSDEASVAIPENFNQ